jgi:hypothetical protein
MLSGREREVGLGKFLDVGFEACGAGETAYASLLGKDGTR